MTKKRKIQIHIAAALVMVCLVGWIVMLYVRKYQEEKSWDNEFSMQYSAVLNDIIWHLKQFEEMKSFDDQLSCLESVTNDLMQLKAYMKVHINLISLSMPEEIDSEINISGWYEAETVIGFINNGGAINSDPIESFRADGVISEEEAAVIRLLKDETEKLQGDMHIFDEDGMNYKYVLSSLEVYQRLAEIMQKVKAQLVQIK